MNFMNAFVSSLEKHNIDVRFIKFLFVGVLNTIFGYSAFAFLIFIGLHYSLAVLIGTIAGILFNFKTTGSLVFKSRDNQLIYRFVSVYVLIYVINVFALIIFNDYEMNLYLTGGIMILPMALLSFVLNKKFVFHNS
jgi:putative flippase GtrA